MADEEQHPSPLMTNSDVLVMMLGIIGVLRALLLTPTIRESPASEEVRATVQDVERRIAATLKAIDEMVEERAQEPNDR